MMLVPQNKQLAPATVVEFVGLFSLQRFEAIDTNVRLCREAFIARTEVSDHHTFMVEIFRFHAHVMNWYNDTTPLKDGVKALIHPSPEVAITDLERWYQRPLADAERNVLFQREAGIIGVLDVMTDALIKEKSQAWVKLVFSEYLPVDQYAQIRLARELCETYGRLLPDDPSLMVPEILAGNIREHILRIAEILRQLTKNQRH